MRLKSTHHQVLWDVPHPLLPLPSLPPLLLLSYGQSNEDWCLRDDCDGMSLCLVSITQTLVEANSGDNEN